MGIKLFPRQDMCGRRGTEINDSTDCPMAPGVGASPLRGLRPGYYRNEMRGRGGGSHSIRDVGGGVENTRGKNEKKTWMRS